VEQKDQKDQPVDPVAEEVSDLLEHPVTEDHKVQWDQLVDQESQENVDHWVISEMMDHKDLLAHEDPWEFQEMLD